ncbi:hypothetical protein K458DRAFT_418781 [Lentithecium fluviatile CBS 122367]|uniref:Uncharacterized protein n=1 Tax=Lentithecium fluviatile CBS 122367 TaxID=1168545 RepID=A0A6G1J0Q1_9PLEO|nr:hypothetical protein K458DRAFT_418781 [Lentithecium fluviatile CBS 122367]
MPMPAKTFLPAFVGFMAFAVGYTTVVARGEGNAIDNARTRWQQQKKRGDEAMSAAGQQWLEEHKH